MIRYLTGIWLWAATTVMIVPGDLVHLISGHEDTRDEVHVNGSQSFEKVHIHCFILKAQLPEYLSFHNTNLTFRVPTEGAYGCIYQSPLIPYHIFSKELRAPPSNN
jgi:hypothetical protein